MTKEQATIILGDMIQKDGTLFDLSHFIIWPYRKKKNMVNLDDVFEIRELEAILWWIQDQKQERKQHELDTASQKLP